jgi:hypothetical protein
VKSRNLDNPESAMGKISKRKAFLEHLEAFIGEMVHYLTVVIKMAETMMLQKAM